MGKWMWYIFVLIAVYLLVVYYRGTQAVGGTLFSGLDTTILYLQGRNSAGTVANYPQ